MIFKINNMKPYTLLIVVAISIIGCKKDKTEGYSYDVRINVADGLSYSVKMQDEHTVNYNVIPPAKNASTTLPNGGIKGKVLFVAATLNPYFKDKEIEVVVTKKDTGEIVVSEKSTNQVVVSWIVK